MPAANPGEHFPERVEHATRRSLHCSHVIVGNGSAQHLAFGRGMFAVGLNVNAEIFIVGRVVEAVMLL